MSGKHQIQAELRRRRFETTNRINNKKTKEYLYLGRPLKKEGVTMEASKYPMFRSGTAIELATWADRLGFSLGYLMKIRDGYRNLGPQAKITWAARAGETVEDMFGPSDE